MTTEDSWRLLIQKLATLVAARKISQIEIARSTGVHQGQVSRILAGNIKRRSRNVQKLCRYAATLEPAAFPNDSAQDLQRAILAVWNGTSEHAAALKQVLHALDAAQRSFRPGKE